QTVVDNSTTEAEYITASNCCGHVIWIQNQLLDYGYNFMQTKIHIDNESTICIVKNLVFHSKTKHIEIRHHFIRDYNEKKLIQVIKIHTNQNVADLLTKAFDVSRFQYLIAKWNEKAAKDEIGDTVKAKTVNGEVQLQALVDKKKVIITESTIRRDLQLEDANGVDCLPNAAIFEQLTLMGYEKPSQKLTFYKAFFSPQWKFLIHTILQCLNAKTTAWNEFSSTMASAIICLAINQKFNFSKYIFDSMVKNVDSMVKFWMYPSGPTEPMADETENVESVPTHSNDPLLSGEDSLKLNELMELCTNLQKKVLDLETTKTIQAREIDSLKRRVKKLEKKQRLRTHKLRRLYKVGVRRKILDIDSDEDITLDSTHVGTDPDMFGVHDLHCEEVFVEIEEHVVNAATTTTTTATTTVADEVEMTLAQTLIEIKSAKPKAKGIVMQEPSESTLTISSQQPSHVKGQGSKDKGKKKMIEPEKPLKKKDQVLFDEQEAIRLQAQFDEEARVAREKEEANAVLVAQWNDIQDKVETDYELAQKLQQKKQEELTIEEKSKLFQQLLKKRRKFFAAKIVEEKRNRPPTKAQQRSIMCTYLKNMKGWKPKDLKTKSFANVQELFDKAMKRVNTFVDFRTKLVEGTEREESSKRDETIGQESSSKRAGDELEQEKAKKQKIDDDQEEAKPKELMEVISDEEGVAIDAIPLSTKSPSIVNYKIIKEGKISIYQIIRANGSSKRYSAVIHMLKNIVREDLETLWKIVKAMHGYTRPEEGYKRVLWGDLKTMFEHHVEDLGRIVGIKRLHDDLRVTAAQLVLLVQSYNCLFRVNAAGTKLQLLKDYNCSRIKTAEKIKIDWRSRILMIVGIKRLHDDLKVKTAQCRWYKVTTAYSELMLLVQSYNCLFRVNAAGTKLQLLKGYNYSRIKTAEKIKIDWRSRILT
ncbi:hypothetical protein Tco_1506217, partial [Tanacetum coccineum]